MFLYSSVVLHTCSAPLVPMVMWCFIHLIYLLHPKQGLGCTPSRVWKYYPRLLGCLCSPFGTTDSVGCNRCCWYPWFSPDPPKSQGSKWLITYSVMLTEILQVFPMIRESWSSALSYLDLQEKKKEKFLFLKFIWLHWILVVAPEIFHLGCGMWEL